MVLTFHRKNIEQANEWPSFIYLTLDREDLPEIERARDEAMTSVSAAVADPTREDTEEIAFACATSELHISLTKTFKLRFHEIESFISSFRTKFERKKTFTVGWTSWIWLANEAESRCYYALCVSSLSSLEMLNQANELLDQYQCDRRDSTILHLSLFWVKQQQLQQYQHSVELPPAALVRWIHCKIGHRKISIKLN
jgi:hypothetical protein